MDKTQIENTLKFVTKSLVEGDFQKIYELDKRKRIPVVEIISAISSYPGNHTMPPEEAFEKYNLLEWDDDIDNSVEFYLWFDSQQSDLTLSIEIYENGGYSIEDIHVL